MLTGTPKMPLLISGCARVSSSLVFSSKRVCCCSSPLLVLTELAAIA